MSEKNSAKIEPKMNEKNMENLITKEEYLNAVSIVEKYHLQIEKAIEQVNITKKTKIMDWDKLPLLSKRLIVGLEYYGSTETVDDIKVSDLAKLRGVGTSAIAEFIKLRGY